MGVIIGRSMQKDLNAALHSNCSETSSRIGRRGAGQFARPHARVTPCVHGHELIGGVESGEKSYSQLLRASLPV